MRKRPLTATEIEDVTLEWVVPDGEIRHTREVYETLRIYGIEEKRVVNKRTGREGTRYRVTCPQYVIDRIAAEKK